MRRTGISENPRQTLDPLTLAGMVLLLEPLLTMVHEIGGHALACAATGGRIAELGAYYVDCRSPDLIATRIVAVAGTLIDVVAAGIAFLLWRRARSALSRTLLWMAFVTKAFVAAGYPLFSGITGLGDWGPGPDGALAALNNPWPWRVALTVIGLVGYIAAVRIAIRMLRAMLGGGAETLPAQRRLPMTLYLGSGAVAVLVGLLNPIGIFITLASAAAASFGGLAGLFNVAFRPPPPGEPLPFVVPRSYPLIALGLVVTVAFAAVLGPSIKLG